MNRVNFPSFVLTLNVAIQILGVTGFHCKKAFVAIRVAIIATPCACAYVCPE